LIGKKDTGNDNHGSVKGGMTGAATFCFD